MGSSSNLEYPDDYNLLSIVKKNVDWTNVDKFLKETSIHTKAKLIAQSHIEGIVDVLQRHDDLQKQKMKSLQSGKSNG